MDKLKELISRAVLVAAWRDGDITTNDGVFATTDVNEMIHLESAIQELFNGMEAYDLICTKRLSDYIDDAIDSEPKETYSRLTEENAKLREVLESLVNPENCKKDIIHIIGNAESLLNQLKDQSNDK